MLENNIYTNDPDPGHLIHVHVKFLCVFFFYISQDSTCTVERPDVSTVLGFVAIVIAIEYTQ